MSRSYESRHETGHGAWARVAGLALLAVTLTVGDGLAQQRIAQDGRLFDANPQIGGSRYNYGYSRPLSPLVGGNPYASGNVGRGLSLRSFSPIRSPTAFRAPLGSGTLSNFRRDSVSVSDQGWPLGGLAQRYFFDPSLTAPTGAYLRGFYDSQLGYPEQVPSRRRDDALFRSRSPYDVSNYGAPPKRLYEPGGPEARLAELERLPFVPGPLTGVEPFTPLSSAIFGPRPPQLPGPLSDTVRWPDSASLPGLTPGAVGAEESAVSGESTPGPLDFRLWPEQPTQLSATPLDVLARERAMRLLTEQGLLEPPQPAEVPGAPDARVGPEGAVAALTTPGGPTLLDTSMLPGSDVFTDMQLALTLSLDPQADWFGEMQAAMQEAARESPTLSVELQTRAALAAEDFLAQMLNMPVQTFVGEGPLAINEELRRAEAAMDFGRYYDAVRHYERARLIDPANPLPLIGKGHALLASGEYVSAAFSLIRGLERFPELTRFQVDLTVLMGGGEIVDIRRADLMQRLARHEDPQLRFLLGYLEVHSGSRELGLQNLDKAAREAKPGSLIRRYPDMLRHKGMLPPAKLPPVEAPDPEADESRVPDWDRPAPGEEPE